MFQNQSYIHLEGYDMIGKDFDSLSFWLDAIPADTVEDLFAQCFLKIQFLQLGKGEGLWNNKKLNLYLCH